MMPALKMVSLIGRFNELVLLCILFKHFFLHLATRITFIPYHRISKLVEFWFNRTKQKRFFRYTSYRKLQSCFY